MHTLTYIWDHAHRLPPALIFSIFLREKSSSFQSHIRERKVDKIWQQRPSEERVRKRRVKKQIKQRIQALKGLMHIIGGLRPQRHQIRGCLCSRDETCANSHGEDLKHKHHIIIHSRPNKYVSFRQGVSPALGMQAVSIMLPWIQWITLWETPWVSWLH